MSRSPGSRSRQPDAQRLRARSVDTRARLKLVAALLGLGCASLVARAVDLQLLHNEFYQREGNARFQRDVPIAASRGMITDRNGEPLAISSPVESIWASPRVLLQHPEQVPVLARALGVTPEALDARLLPRAERDFVWLRRHLTPDDAQAIEALKIPGVGSQREFRRFYPLGEAAAHILGFTNIDDRGQEGLELAYDSWLTGTPGVRRVIRDGAGRQIAGVDLIRAAEPGHTLALSIDRRLQHLAYRELQKALTENQADAGSVVVLDVASGEVLAMANLPSYNPNAREGSRADERRNRAVTDLIEPGSTFKPFIVAAALETGKVTPDTKIETWPGTMQVAGHTVRDVRNFGTLTTTGLLTKSSNVAAVKLALDMPTEHIHDVLRRFGFGQATGIGFPGEASGVLREPRSWGTLPKATIAFGYGISVTPLQLAQAYAALGNGGHLMSPSFLRDPRTEGRDVIDPGIARQLTDMLVTVTGPEGTARRAAISGYLVAGKSGTSRKAGAGGYDRRYVSLFAGLVPATQPRFAVVVMVDDPKSRDAAGNLVYYGGAVAAPVFQSVMGGAMRLLDVVPDDIQALYAASAPMRAPSTAGTLPPEAESVPGLFEATP
ncbi:MAG TPA: penicillin-binding protein 2 [Chiayiivirga sp.]|nr:penicillin-binding protein 2 [Chiayiivirga sp.]